MCSAQALGKMDAALPAAVEREDPGAYPIYVGWNFKLERRAGFIVNQRQKSYWEGKALFPTGFWALC